MTKQEAIKKAINIIDGHITLSSVSTDERLDIIERLASLLSK